MIDPRLCEAEGCLVAAVVGVGEPPRWLCLGHAEEWLAQVGDTLRRIRNQLWARNN